MSQTAHALGPYSRPNAVAKVDGRRKEARLMRETVADLTRHIGGNASATQRILIERAAWLSLHLALMDRRTIDGNALDERDGRQYLAWHNSLTRLLRELGIRESAQKPGIEGYLASKAAGA